MEKFQTNLKLEDQVPAHKTYNIENSRFQCNNYKRTCYKRERKLLQREGTFPNNFFEGNERM
jgi:hypothetical protein